MKKYFFILFTLIFYTRNVLSVENNVGSGQYNLRNNLIVKNNANTKGMDSRRSLSSRMRGRNDKTSTHPRQPLELNWLNLALVYKERYFSKSNFRLEKQIAEQTADVGNPWRLDPKLTATYNKATIDNSQTSGSLVLTQSLPTGTSFNFNASQTVLNDNVTFNSFINRDNIPNDKSYYQSSSFGVTQSLLKGSFLYGMPDVTLNHAQKEQSFANADQIFAKNLKIIYFDYIDVLNNSLLLKQAQNALERAKKSLAETQDAVKQGFKAKSDIYTFQISLNNNQINVDNIQAQYDNSLKKLNFDLWQDESEMELLIPTHINFDNFSRYLKEKISKKISFEEKIAQTQHALNKAQENKVKNDSLPQLDFSFSIQKNDNNTPYVYQTNQGSFVLPAANSSYQEIYGVTLSMPLYSSLTRDTVSIANAKVIESNSSLLQEKKNKEMNWEIDQKNIEINESKVKLKLNIKQLSEKNLEAIINLYRDGKVTNTDVQTNQDKLDTSEVDYIQAQSDLVKNLLNSAYNSGSLLDLFYE